MTDHKVRFHWVGMTTVYLFTFPRRQSIGRESLRMHVTQQLRLMFAASATRFVEGLGSSALYDGSKGQDAVKIRLQIPSLKV